MIYYGNFKSNFLSADASGDHKMKRDILLSEIAKIIIGSPGLVKKHLNESGFSIDKNANKPALVNAVSAALKKSRVFANKMACEIIGGNYGAVGSPDSTTTVQPTTAPVESTTSTTTSTPTSTTTTPTTTTATRSTDTSSTTTQPVASVMPTQTTTTATTSAPAPIIIALGEAFGGLPTTNIPYSARTTSSGGDSGGGFGGGSASSDLQEKVNALDAKKGISKNMKIGLWLALGISAGVGAWYYFK